MTDWPQPTDPNLTVVALTSDVGPISTQTVLQTITGLAFPIGASSTEMWEFELWLIANSANATMDLKLGVAALPSGATALWGIIPGISTLAGWAGQAIGATQAALTAGGTSLPVASAANGTFGVPAHGVVFGGGTAGNVQFQYAQNTSDGGNLTIKAGTLLKARKVVA